jgi:hypothetical protein
VSVREYRYDVPDVEADVALVATTAKTVLGVLAPAQFGVDLRGFEIAFDGVTTTDKPVLVEICSARSRRTRRARTRRRRRNIVQIYGRAITAGFTAAYNWTTEPTVLGATTAVKTLRLTPNGGTYDYDWPLGETPDNDVSKGFAVRCTAPTSAVNVRASLRFERCSTYVRPKVIMSREAHRRSTRW